MDRANHAYILYTDNGRKKVMVAGGVSVGQEGGIGKPLNSVEILDWPTGAWIEGQPLPASLVGGKFITVEGRIVLVGRYGQEHTNRMMVYNTGEKAWQVMPVNLLKGRSDMAVVQVPSKHNENYSCP